MAKERNLAFDLVKCIAIYLVVLGHCMQYFGHTSMSDNMLHGWIYSFHMPLFFMVSGFFAAGSWKLPVWEFLRKMAIRLLLPCVVMGLMLLPLRGIGDLSIVNVLSLQWFPLWFIRELFKIQILIYCCVRISGKRMWLAVLLSLLVLVLPFCAVMRMMVPFFWIGYFMSRRYDWILTHILPIVLSLVFLTIILYFFWSPEVLGTYYNSIPWRIQDLLFGKTGWNEIVRVGYRMLVALSMSVLVILLCECLRGGGGQTIMFATIGRSTMGIYVAQTWLVEVLLPYCVDLSMLNAVVRDWIVMPLVAIVLVIICYGLYWLMSKNRYLGALLFGEKSFR